MTDAPPRQRLNRQRVLEGAVALADEIGIDALTIRKLAIHDKHGITRSVFNAKINIYRSTGEPILLGIEDRMLRGDELAVTTAAHIRPLPPHRQ